MIQLCLMIFVKSKILFEILHQVFRFLDCQTNLMSDLPKRGREFLAAHWSNNGHFPHNPYIQDSKRIQPRHWAELRSLVKTTQTHNVPHFPPIWETEPPFEPEIFLFLQSSWIGTMLWHASKWTELKMRTAWESQLICTTSRLFHACWEIQQ